MVLLKLFISKSKSSGIPDLISYDIDYPNLVFHVYQSTGCSRNAGLSANCDTDFGLSGFGSDASGMLIDSGDPTEMFMRCC